MSSLGFALLCLVSGTVDVVPGHTAVVVAGKSYHLVLPGETLDATAPESEGEVLEIDFVRIAKRGRKSRPPQVHVVVGETRETVIVRSPVVQSRAPKGQRTWRASYPVRHRFPLTGGAVGGVMRIEVTASDAPDGILVALAVRAPPEERLGLSPLVPLVPLAPLTPPAPADDDATPGGAPPTDAAATPTPTPTPTPAPTPSSSGAPPPPAAEPMADTGPAKEPAAPAAPTTTTAPPSAAPPPTTTEPPATSRDATVAPPIQSPTSSEPATPSSISADAASPRWPVTLHTQVSPGLALQPLFALSPLALAFGARLSVGAREGILSRFGFGLGFDVGTETASTRPGSLSANVRWTTTAARVRVEAEARAVSLTIGPGTLSLGGIVGVGAIVGAHAFQVGDVSTTRALFGPTLRAAPLLGVGLGPGELTCAIPLDVSVDVTSGVRGYWPFASTVLVGYRLTL